jgi:hypothetical protein
MAAIPLWREILFFAMPDALPYVANQLPFVAITGPGFNAARPLRLGCPS